MAYVITEPCIDVKHKTCVDVCPVSCIYLESDELARMLEDKAAVRARIDTLRPRVTA